MAQSVKHERKKELQVSLSLKKGPHTLHSVKYKSLQKKRWKLIHYFNIVKAKLPARTLHHQEKKKECKICYA